MYQSFRVKNITFIATQSMFHFNIALLDVRLLLKLDLHQNLCQNSTMNRFLCQALRIFTKYRGFSIRYFEKNAGNK